MIGKEVQYFKIMFHCNYDYNCFIEMLDKECSSIQIYVAEIGRLYFRVVGNDVVAHIFLSQKPQGITMLKWFTRKPYISVKYKSKHNWEVIK